MEQSERARAKRTAGCGVNQSQLLFQQQARNAPFFFFLLYTSPSEQISQPAAQLTLQVVFHLSMKESHLDFAHTGVFHLAKSLWSLSHLHIPLLCILCFYREKSRLHG